MLFHILTDWHAHIKKSYSIISPYAKIPWDDIAVLYFYRTIDPMYMNFLNIPITYSRASAIFVGVYEPTKRKLLETFPENLSAVAHFVS